MEKVDQEKNKKSKKVEIKVEDQTIDDKDEKDFGHPTFDTKLKTEDEVQQTETVTVIEQVEDKLKAQGFGKGAEAVAENPDNRQLMQVLQNIEEQLKILTKAVANLQRDALPPKQPAVTTDQSQPGEGEIASLLQRTETPEAQGPPDSHSSVSSVRSAAHRGPYFDRCSLF
ncbi:uncharacterized protein LOC144429509 [Styela clava]